jgi:hypothetical protein
MKRRGWYGDSQGHALAAKGIRRYNKQKLVDPVFYAQKNEKQLPFNHIMDMVQQKKTFTDMQRMHPDADKEDMRQRAIKAVAMRDADDTLTKLDKNGVDLSVKMAQQSTFFRMKANDALQDSQKRSLLKEEKAELLKKRMGEIR